MTARFGRNKRRRAREALAASEAETQAWRVAHERESALLRECTKSLGILRGQFADMARMLPKYHAALAPETLNVEEKTPERFDHGAAFELDIVPAEIGFVDDARMSPMELGYRVMSAVDAYVLSCRMDIEQGKYPMSVALRFRNGEVRLALNDIGARTMGDERLVRWIAQELLTKARQTILRRGGM